jgi:hypothetical protein
LKYQVLEGTPASISEREARFTCNTRTWDTIDPRGAPEIFREGRENRLSCDAMDDYFLYSCCYGERSIRTISNFGLPVRFILKKPHEVTISFSLENFLLKKDTCVVDWNQAILQLWPLMTERCPQVTQELYSLDIEQSMKKLDIFSLARLPRNLVDGSITLNLIVAEDANLDTLVLEPGNDIDKRLLEFEIKHYNSVGSVRETSNPFMALLREVQPQVMIRKYGISPYIAVIASSGSGKSQLPFSLAARNIACIRFVMESGTPQADQPIYQSCRSFSTYFHDCLEDDIVTLKRNGVNNVCSTEIFKRFSILKLPLRTIGFLQQVIDGVLHGTLDGLNDDFTHQSDTLKCGPISFQQFEAFAKKMASEMVRTKKKFEMPVIFLDEYNMSKNELDKHPENSLYIFARNLVRLLGLVCVTMGTDSVALNLINLPSPGSTRSRCGEAGPVPWVYVVHQLPAATLNSIPGAKDILKDLSQIAELKPLAEYLCRLPCPNPWFLTLCFRYLERLLKSRRRAFVLVDVLYGMISFARDIIFRAKLDDDHSSAFSNGQLVINYHYWKKNPLYNGDEEAPEALQINRHFAYLYSTSKKPLKLKRKKQGNKWFLADYDSGAQWKPSFYYPQMTGNDLFYIILLVPPNVIKNIKNPSLFSCALKSTRDAYEEFEAGVKQVNLQLDRPNRQCDGRYMENLIHTALVVASRRGGLKPLQMPAFFEWLITELQKGGLVKKSLDPKCDFAKDFKNLDITFPILSPLEELFDLFKILLSNCNNGCLEYTRNREKIDGKIKTPQTLNTTEAKQLEDPVGGNLAAGFIANNLCSPFWTEANNYPEAIQSMIFICPRVTRNFDADLKQAIDDLTPLPTNIPASTSKAGTTPSLKPSADLIIQGSKRRAPASAGTTNKEPKGKKQKVLDHLTRRKDTLVVYRADGIKGSHSFTMKRIYGTICPDPRENFFTFILPMEGIYGKDVPKLPGPRKINRAGN